MFRDMRRFKQALTFEECQEVLKKNTSGVLAVLGDDDYPYAVPLSYVYLNGNIYFHCAVTGHKIDAIVKHEKVSFCIIDQDQVIPEKYTTLFRSVVAFGKARIIKNKEEMLPLIEALAAHYSPLQVEGRAREIEQSISRIVVIELAVEHLTGKVSRELMKNA